MEIGHEDGDRYIFQDDGTFLVTTAMDTEGDNPLQRGTFEISNNSRLVINVSNREISVNALTNGEFLQWLGPDGHQTDVFVNESYFNKHKDLFQ